MRNAKVEEMVAQAMPGANPVEQDTVCRRLAVAVEDGWEITGLRMNVFGEVFASLVRPAVGATSATYKSLWM